MQVRKGWLWAIAAVIILGAAVRATALTDGYWIDEVISIETARLPFHDLMQRVGFLDVHPPLYYLALSAFSFVSGGGEIYVRLLSLALGLASIVLMAAWAWRRGPWVAFATVMMVAFSTFHVHYSLEARPYALLVALSAGLLYLYDRFEAEDQPGRVLLVMLLVTEASLIMTHYCGAVLVLALNAHFYTVRRHDPLKLVRWSIAQAACIAVFGLWLPFLLVQYLHLPSDTFKHLGHDGTLGRIILAFGPAPVHPSTFAAWAGAIALLSAALAGVVRGFAAGLAATTSNNAAVSVPHRRSLAAATLVAAAVALIACVCTPLITVWGIEVSEATLPLVLDVLPPAFGIIGAAVALVVAATWWNLAAVRRGHRIDGPAFALPLVAAGLAALYFFGKGLQARNAIVALPLVLGLAASSIVPRKLTAVIAMVALVLGLNLPSLANHHAAFEPRQDFRGVARFIRGNASDAPSGVANFVLPMWDRPGVEFYLGPGTANGVMSPSQLPPREILPDKVFVVLTREAMEESKAYVSAISAVLGKSYRLVRSVPFRMAVVVEFQRSPNGE